MARSWLHGQAARLLPVAVLAAQAGLAAAVKGPAPKDASPRLRCIIEGMGSCLAPAGPAGVQDAGRCLSVGAEQCRQRQGEWLGPELPTQWRRLEGALSPCYADGPGGQVRCLPLVLNLAPSKSGTEDLYKRLLAHPSVIRNDPVGRLMANNDMGSGFYAQKEPTFWTHAEIENFTLDDFARAYHPLASEVSDALKAQGTHGQPSSGAVQLRGRKKAALIASQIGVDFSAVTLDANPALIHAAMPESRFVALLRHPVKRAESQYNFAFARIDGPGCDLSGKHTPESYHRTAELVVGEFNKCKKNASPVECWRLLQKRRTWGCKKWETSAKFIMWSMYGVYFSWFLEHFPREQFFVRRLEDVDFVQNEPLARRNMLELYNFVGIEPQLPPSAEAASFRQVHHHTHSSGEEYVSMSNRTSILLQDFYNPYVKQLQQAFDDPGLAWW